MGNGIGYRAYGAGNQEVNLSAENYVQIRTDDGVFHISQSESHGRGSITIRGRGSIFVRGRGRTYGIWSTHVRSGYISFERSGGDGFQSARISAAASHFGELLASVRMVEDAASNQQQEDVAPDPEVNRVEDLELSSDEADFDDALGTP
ncbi:uncharacterized protein [Drosophila takahashii]|uniref:uncharacterized protein isoform X1 n=1 Tax=Drosophila takahashii TaxID=29030 RepID=UPI001CF827FD|nr:uncharacterized protein LOC108064430 [Drosophila takahashii]